jgi:hypothetical protein
MRTGLVRSRQLCWQLAAGMLPGDHVEQQNGERSIGDWNRKLKQKLKKKHAKSAVNSKYKCALVLCIHVSFVCNQQLAHCQVTIAGSVMQSGGLAARIQN